MRKRTYQYKVSYKDKGNVVYLEGTEEISGQSFFVAKQVLISKLARREGIAKKRMQIVSMMRVGKDGNAIV